MTYDGYDTDTDTEQAYWSELGVSSDGYPSEQGRPMALALDLFDLSAFGGAA